MVTYSRNMNNPKDTFYFDEEKNNKCSSTNHYDYGNYNEKTKELEQKLYNKYNTPPKISKSYFLFS